MFPIHIRHIVYVIHSCRAVIRRAVFEETFIGYIPAIHIRTQIKSRIRNAYGKLAPRNQHPEALV